METSSQDPVLHLHPCFAHTSCPTINTDDSQKALERILALIRASKLSTTDLLIIEAESRVERFRLDKSAGRKTDEDKREDVLLEALKREFFLAQAKFCSVQKRLSMLDASANSGLKQWKEAHMGDLKRREKGLMLEKRRSRPVSRNSLRNEED